MIKSRIVRIGNSQGVCLPKPLLEHAGLAGDDVEVELHAEAGRVVIAAARRTRAGWAQAARLMHERHGDDLLDAPTSTRLGDEDWETFGI